MKIAILGSTYFMGGERVESEFIRACQQIGREIAKRKHTLIVASDNPNTADRHVVEGVNEVKGKHKVIVLRPENDAKPTPFKENEAYENIDFDIRRIHGEFAIVHLYSMEMADLVMVIGGGKGVVAASHSSIVLKKPMLVISAFGGSTRDIAPNISEYYRRCKLTDKEVSALRETWTQSSETMVLNAAEKLVKHNPFKKKHRRFQVMFLMMQLFFLITWITIFTFPILFSKGISFFLLLVLSAVLGVGLRTNLRIVRQGLQNTDIGVIINEIAIGIALSFGFYLLYFSGQLVINGNIDLSMIDSDFRRISMTMSTIAFGGSLLLEKSLEKLKSYFGDVL